MGGGRERGGETVIRLVIIKINFKKMTQSFQGPQKPFSLPQDLVAWVTVGFSHEPHSESVPRMAAARSFVGFSLQPFNFFYTAGRHLDTTAKDTSNTKPLGTRSA